MAVNYRRGEHLDITTQPWLGSPVAFAPLTKLLARLPSEDSLRGHFYEAYKSLWHGKTGCFITIHADSKKPTLALFVANMLEEMNQDMTEHTIKLRLATRDTGETIDNVSIQDLTTVSIYELGTSNRTPHLFVLAAAWRTIIERRPGAIPGLNFGLSLAGIHFVLNQFGIDTTKEN